MLASLLSPTFTSNTTKNDSSKLLPSVKCSTCNQPVPLDELGDHTCSPPQSLASPISAPPSKTVSPGPVLPKPSLSQEEANALLPGRLQNRVVNANNGISSANGLRAQSPSNPSSRQSSSSASTVSSSSTSNSSSTSYDRLRISTKSKGTTSPTFQPKSSPLARKDSQAEDSSTMKSRSRSSSRERLGDKISPLRTRPPPTDPFSSNRHNNNNSSISSSISSNSNLRIRTPSNSNGTISAQNTPSTARPLGSFSAPDRDMSPVLTARPTFPSGPAGGPPPLRNGTPLAPGAAGMMPNRTGPTPPPSQATPPNSINFPSRMGPSPGPIPNHRDPRMNANPRNTPPPPMQMQIQQRQQQSDGLIPTNESFVPPAERGIDTKTGGEAGMAGVGRRGFAAAARAAMFVQNAGGPGAYPQQGYGAMGVPSPGGGYGNGMGMARRPNAPQFLDIDAASRSTSTPPLSAGSGYSSHSPGGPTSPPAQADFARTQAPPGGLNKPALQIPPAALNNSSNNLNPNHANTPLSAVSPTAGGRLPFFDKLKNSIGFPSSDTASMSSSISGAAIERSQSASSSASSLYPREKTPVPQGRGVAANDHNGRNNIVDTGREKEVPPPPSPIDSESEYGGLAYADSTDNEDNDSTSRYDDDGEEDLDDGLARAERRRRRGLSEKDKGMEVGMRNGKGHYPGYSQSSQNGIGATMLGRNGTASSTSSSRADDSLSRRLRDRESSQSRERSRGSGHVMGARSMNASRSASRTRPPLDGRGGQNISASAATAGDAFKKGHAQFGSVSARSRSVSTDRDGSHVNNGRMNASGHAPSLSQSSVVSSSALRMGLSHSREGSVSSNYSSTSAGAGVRGNENGGSPSKQGVRTRVDSAAAIAAALGLSRSNSTQSINAADYARLGGPGVPRRADSSRSRREEADRDNGGDIADKRRDGRRDGSVGLSLERGGVNDRTPRNEREIGRQKLTVQVDEEVRGRGTNVVNGIGSATMKSASRRGDRDRGDYANGDDTLSRSKTVQSPETSRPIKLPARSMTSPTMERDKALLPSNNFAGGSAGGSSLTAGLVQKKRRPSPKTCVRCENVIDDGRWVSVGADMPASKAGGVLCEKCWKGMYLPKCRRCNLPIEKQAVSSSDGQLKGKYHRECFNCHVCNKPFPDKSFYVYDGKPLCAYHYHEANDSLCAAALCGQPIEGPCAVSHTGDRYHPEHMTCEFYADDLDRDCGVRLEEYWEVDGRMLCERHANVASRYGYASSGRGSGSEDDTQQRRDGRAKKRITRFIDLTGGGGGAPGLGDSGLR
ncbi:hypothetical protein CPC08DRAFT_705366 [Agrocybe pediades]|nr:hypothetical protein CPC08DRAFT_705366 [Agrocybe pediades]